MKQRFVEIFIDGEWHIRTFAAIKKGAIFKVFDPDGTMFESETGGELIALTDAIKINDEYTVDYINKV